MRKTNRECVFDLKTLILFAQLALLLRLQVTQKSLANLYHNYYPLLCCDEIILQFWCR